MRPLKITRIIYTTECLEIKIATKVIMVMFNRNKKGFKPRSKKAAKAKAVTRSLTPNQKKEVVKLVQGQAEKKTVAFYQDYNAGTTITAPYTGLYANRGWAVQNNYITNNLSDILQIIPFVVQGTDDNNRIGQRITVNSLYLTGQVRVVNERVNSHTPTNMEVYIYIMQHVSLKDYTNLRNANDFNLLLETGEPATGTSTVAFEGLPQHAMMPISRQNYKVLHRKKITLWYAGQIGTAGLTSVSNGHVWLGNFSFNLTKNVPKVLQYPETNVLLPPYTSHTPTNTSIFMCMGFVDVGNTSFSNGGESSKPWLEQTYVSHLSFTDL